MKRGEESCCSSSPVSSHKLLEGDPARSYATAVRSRRSDTRAGRIEAHHTGIVRAKAALARTTNSNGLRTHAEVVPARRTTGRRSTPGVQSDVEGKVVAALLVRSLSQDVVNQNSLVARRWRHPTQSWHIGREAVAVGGRIGHV